MIDMKHTPEPFGFFRAEPFGWTDCAETDEGARPLLDQAAIYAVAKLRDQLLAALRLVAAEVTDGVRPTSADSYLPSDVVREVHAAIAAAEQPAQRNALRDDVYVAGGAA